MKHSSLRAFGIALFLIGALYTAIEQFNIPVSSFGIDVSTISDSNATQQIQTLKAELQQANKTISSLQAELEQTGAEKTSKTAQQDTEKAANQTEQQNEADPTDSATAEATYTLEIYRNMTPYAIGEKLEDAGIIENAIELEMFLARDEYRGRLQIGSFALHSNMSLQEIAETITKTKTNE